MMKMQVTKLVKVLAPVRQILIHQKDARLLPQVMPMITIMAPVQVLLLAHQAIIIQVNQHPQVATMPVSRQNIANLNVKMIFKVL